MQIQQGNDGVFGKAGRCDNLSDLHPLQFGRNAIADEVLFIRELARKYDRSHPNGLIEGNCRS